MKILMVCLGNICRSPMAEGIMQHLVEQNGLDWQIDSAGTGNWHVGEGPDRRSVLTARNHGIDISNQVCRQFRRHDFSAFDLILVMDKYNRSDVLTMAPDEQAAAKVKLLLVDMEVPDPYFDESQFEAIFEMIEQGCKDIIQQLSGSF
ncbi:MAG: low molecular weight phosphotyrosine protein phosphatase [Mucilaginibacter sp.]|nr:low molecular weight phosphotyrosine protein phosphatase [Mucilaginibacter sp.]